MPEPGTETQPEKNEKPVFSDEQQIRVNELIREAQGRAAKDVRTEAARLAAEVVTLKEQLAEQLAEKPTTEKVVDTKTSEPDFKAENQRIKREYENENKLAKQEAQRERDDSTALRQELKEVRRQEAIRTAMDSLGVEFVSPKAAVKLSEESIVWDEDRKRYVVHDDKGQLRYNKALEPLDLSEFYHTFVSDNPYLIKAQLRSGAGSKESSAGGSNKYKLEDLFGSKSKGQLAQKLAAENITEYRRMRAVAKEQGLI